MSLAWNFLLKIPPSAIFKPLSAIMKTLLILILSFLILSCSELKTEKEYNQNTESFTKKYGIERFDSILASMEIKPTFSTSLDSLKYFTNKINIQTEYKNETFKILVGDDVIIPKNLETINVVWSEKDSVSYANEITEIKYYEPLNLLLIKLGFYPCTGLGCGVNYQLIYNMKTKETHAFGRFRTGFDMNLYSIENRNYYLSKTFYGRNAQLKDTIYFQIYNLADLSNKESQGKTIARFTFENEDYDNPTSSKVEKLK